MIRTDLLWKAALEDLFDDFLRFFIPDAGNIFDFTRGFEYLDKELDQLYPPQANDYTAMYVDKLIKVFTIGGKEEWVLVHVEVQGQTDQNFAERMFQYYYRIFDRYKRPITAFAIFADTHKNFHPKYYERDFLGTKLFYGFNTYKILDQNDAVLDSSDNPFAMAVMCAKFALSGIGVKDEHLFDQAYILTKHLLKKQLSREKIRKVIAFLSYYLRFENPEMYVKFDKEIVTLTGGHTTMGIYEFLLEEAKRKANEAGMEAGMEAGIEAGIKKATDAHALKMKQNGLTLSLISNITGLSVEEIEKLS